MQNTKWKILRGVILLGALVLTLAAATISPALADQPNGAQVEISMAGADIAAGEEIIALVVIRNPGSEEIKILNWFTPLAESLEPVFIVTRNGEPVAYTGAIYKRPQPTRADYITLAAGESLTGEVNLTSLYDFSVSGEYQIVFHADSENLYATDDGRRLTRIPGVLTSNALDVFIAAHIPAPIEQITPEAISGSTSFLNCTAARQTALTSARIESGKYADKAVTYFNSGYKGARYTTWFGVYNATRYSTVKNNFSKIRTAMNTAAVTFNCGCNDAGVYAYVYPNQPYKIWLCGAFWSSPTTGTDSKAGTLIHEMSHFEVVANTDDYVYGKTGSKNLAVSNPGQAIANADNYEYFSENTPAITEEPPVTSSNLLKDPGFEIANNPDWTQSSTNFGTVVCTADCYSDPINEPNIAKPRSGLAWAWFGGTVNNETATLSQSVTFPSGSANLLFYFWIGEAGAGSDADDVFTVKVDGSTVFSANATQKSSYAAYKLVNLNVSQFADGGSHTIEFSANTTGQAVSFNVDDVVLAKLSIKTLVSQAIYDGWTLELSTGSKVGGSIDGGSTVFRVGDDAGNRQYRGILSFNTKSAIPSAAVITKITMKVMKSGSVGGDPLALMQGFMTDVKKGAFNTAGLEVGDFQAVANKTLGPVTPALQSGWYTLNLTNAKSYINRSGVTQVRLRFKLASNTNGIANYLNLYSGNSGTASYRPKLIIQYYVP